MAPDKESIIWRLRIKDGTDRTILIRKEETIKIGRNPPGPNDIVIDARCTYVSRIHGEVIVKSGTQSLECYYRDIGSSRRSYIKHAHENPIICQEGRGSEPYQIYDATIVRLGDKKSSEKTCDIEFIKEKIVPTAEPYN
jgi:pSer/pThr/pTyr-binding forkhead associated (FHA) protein